jgi:Starch-binding associating with outer membrane
MKYKIVIIAIAITGIFQSCKKTFFTDENQNPNVVSSVTPPLLLSTTEAALAYTLGGDFSRFASYFDQQVFGESQQSQTIYQYGVNPGTFDNLWPDLYTSTIENNATLIQISDKGGYNAYGGVARILMAYTLQVAVDQWGKIPYSQAAQGNLAGGSLTPVYDDDKALYDTISGLIDKGIAFLNNTSAGAIKPGSEDVIYGGNAAQWIKFGHAIKARLYIHQSKSNAAMATSALTEIAASFGSNADNAQYIWGSTQTSANPWYQFNRDRPGYTTFSNSPFAARLASLNDPRYPIFIDSVNDGLAINPGNTHYGGLADYYGSISAPTEFITYDELLFIKAEATVTATSGIASAQTFYQSAITANMQKLGVSPANITAYLAANGTLPTTNAGAISQIASQEFIALFLNPEAWTVWRRTNSPALTPVSGSNGVPRRLEYPQSEYSYNPKNVPIPANNNTLFAPKVFWDN